MATPPCSCGTFVFASTPRNARPPSVAVPPALPPVPRRPASKAAPAAASAVRAASAELLERRTLLSAANPADPAVLRIDAGGPAYTDSAGHFWAADSSAVGGSADGDPFPVAGTADPKLFTSRRTGNFAYDLPAAPGSYELELLFAEPYYRAGGRVFDVTANGRPLLTHFDVAAKAGTDAALTETLPVTVASGSLDLDFTGVTGNAILSGLALLPASSFVPAPAAAGTLSILPLGDSITYGSTTHVYPSGGYRSRLYQDFTSAGQSIRFLGSVYDTWSPLLQKAGEAWHEGHGGYTIQQISQNFDGVGPGNSTSPNNGGHWIDGTGSRRAVYPDVILLHAGTNDILERHTAAQAASDMDALVRKITTERPDAELFVAAILPLADPAKNAQVRVYNALLRTTVVPEYQRLGKHVLLVDQYSRFVDTKGNVLTSHFGDGIHPDRTGYDWMGDTWYAAIEQYEKAHAKG